jgi:hypothetical protein
VLSVSVLGLMIQRDPTVQIGVANLHVPDVHVGTGEDVHFHLVGELAVVLPGPMAVGVLPGTSPVGPKPHRELNGVGIIEQALGLGDGEAVGLGGID